MNHYTREQWKNYKGGNINSQQSLLMEGHLRECEQCLEQYLSLFEEQDLTVAGTQIPDQFSSAVMTIIKAEYSVNPEKTDTVHIMARIRARRRILAYYTAAAVITVMLTGSGLFNSLAEKAYEYQNIPIKQEQTQKQIEYGWPSVDDRIINLFQVMKGGKQ